MESSYGGIIPFFGTNDLEATSEFYEGLLGLSLFKDQGNCRIYQVRPGAHVGFCTHLEVVQGKRSPIITLLTESVDKVYHKIRTEKQYPIEEERIVNAKYNIYHFFVKDPNGYLVEIQKFLD